MHTPVSLLLVRPAAFGSNPETQASNSFQKDSTFDPDQVLMEFDGMVETLSNAGIDLHVAHDLEDPPKPDAVFPNNWISMHDGVIILYPMLAESRRLERNSDILEHILEHFHAEEIVDLTDYENDGQYLEGTGSIVFDHQAKRAYANESPRTNLGLLTQLCDKLGYASTSFKATNAAGQDIYHTNVLMAITHHCALVCLEALPDLIERQMLRTQLEQDGKQVVELTFAQMQAFAGNAFEVLNELGEYHLIMSQTGVDSLNSEQLEIIESDCKLLPVNIPTIEHIGGGSARCMVAGILLEEK